MHEIIMGMEAVKAWCHSYSEPQVSQWALCSFFLDSRVFEGER